jgi:hypothetical protein
MENSGLFPCKSKYLYPQLETLANILDSYRRFRHDAIYGLDFAIDDKEAKAALDSAKEILKKPELTQVFVLMFLTSSLALNRDSNVPASLQ